MLAIGIFIAARAHAAARRGSRAGRTAFARGRRRRGEKSASWPWKSEIAISRCVHAFVTGLRRPTTTVPLRPGPEGQSPTAIHARLRGGPHFHRFGAELIKNLSTSMCLLGQCSLLGACDGKAVTLDSPHAPHGPMGSFLASPSTRILPVGPHPPTTTMHFSDHAARPSRPTATSEWVIAGECMREHVCDMCMGGKDVVARYPSTSTLASHGVWGVGYGEV